MGLTKNDKEELNKAILEYLNASGYSIAFEAFKNETSLELPDDPKRLK